MQWQYLKAPEFPEAVRKSKGVCVIPIGAMEKHGPHMPVGTDNIIAERTALLAAELEPVVVFPTFDFGHVNGLQSFIRQLRKIPFFSKKTRSGTKAGKILY